jgi:hypothetical protein
MRYRSKSSHSQVYPSQELAYTFFIDYLGCQVSSDSSLQIADTKQSSLQAMVPVNSAVPARLGLEAPALAWLEVALASLNDEPG